MNVGNSDQVMG